MNNGMDMNRVNEAFEQARADLEKADGFDSVEDFWAFFKEHYGWEDVEMVVIRWCDFKAEEAK